MLAGNTGTETCTAGTWGNDTCDPFEGAIAEVCEGSLDEDCDGVVDEGCDCTDGDTRTTTCGIGECASTGTETCTAGVWGGDTCMPGAPTAEVCDNLDNNCDGATDENLTRPTTCGVGECAGNTGTETCTAGTWGNDTCDPFEGATAEVCDDNADNDCDGSVDIADPDCVLPPANPPYIKELDDDDGEPGDDEKIKGRYFGKSQGSSYVQFGSVRPKIKDWRNYRIKYYIPNLPKGKYPVSVWVNGIQSNVKYFEVKEGEHDHHSHHNYGKYKSRMSYFNDYYKKIMKTKRES